MIFKDALFGLVTLYYMLAAVRFAMMVCAIPDRLHKPINLRLVRGQFKDGLLAAALMWAIFLSKDASTIKEVFDVVGTLLFLWLIRRTTRRMSLLSR